MLETILFDHDDLDAAGCKIIFSIAHSHKSEGDDYKIIHCSNNNVDEIVRKNLEADDIDENTEIFFSDICASREVMEHIVSKFKTVKVWDHHRTNFFITHIIPDAVIVPENSMGILESGTSLIYQHYAKLSTDDPKLPYAKYFNDSNSILPKLVDTIRSYDTFEFKETNNLDAKKLQLLFYMLGMKRFCNRYIDIIMSDEHHDELFTDNDKDFIDARLENEQRIIDSINKTHVYDVSIRGYNAAFIMSTGGASISELGYQFLNKYPEYDVLIGYSFYLDGGAYSFRCIRDDIDAGKTIGGPIGGGGHPKAAGAPIPKEIKDQIASILLSNIDSNYQINNIDFDTLNT